MHLSRRFFDAGPSLRRHAVFYSFLYFPLHKSTRRTSEILASSLAPVKTTSFRILSIFLGKTSAPNRRWKLILVAGTAMLRLNGRRFWFVSRVEPSSPLISLSITSRFLDCKDFPSFILSLSILKIWAWRGWW